MYPTAVMVLTQTQRSAQVTDICESGLLNAASPVVSGTRPATLGHLPLQPKQSIVRRIESQDLRTLPR